MDSETQGSLPPPSPLQAPNWKRQLLKLGDVILENIFTRLKLKNVYDYLRKEPDLAKLLKAALIPVCVMIAVGLFAGATVGFTLSTWTFSKRIADRDGRIASLKEQASEREKRKDEAIDQKREENQKLARELSDCKIEMAPIKALAASLFTNLPPAQQIQALASNLQSISNDIRLLRPSGFDFRLIINGTTILASSQTNEAAFLLGLTNYIYAGAKVAGKPFVYAATNAIYVKRIVLLTNDLTFIGVFNDGNVTAENLTVQISTTEGEFTASEGWNSQGNLMSGRDFTPTSFPVWTVKAGNTIPNGTMFTCPPIKVHPSWTGSPFTAVVTVFADRCQAVEYQVVFVR